MSRTFGTCGSNLFSLQQKVVSTIADTVSAGESGDVIDLPTPAVGQIGFLRCLNAGTDELGMTLTVDGNVIQSGATLDNAATDSGQTSFIVSTGFAGAGSSGGPTYLSGNVYAGLYFNTSLVLAKDTGSTASNINYTVDYMEPLS